MSEVARLDTPAARLARLGFLEVDRALQTLRTADNDAAALAGELLDDLAVTADPDLALDGLVRLVQAAARSPHAAGLPAALRTEATLRQRLLAVLGVSATLADHLVKHPEHWQALATPAADGRGSTDRVEAELLRAQLLQAVGADPNDPAPRAALPAAPGATLAKAEQPAAAAMRVAYRRELLRVAGRDLTGEADLEETAGALADLAGGVLEAALAVARAELPADAAACRLAVLGMGKCGGSELNYVSDVDVVFVAEPASAPDGGQVAESVALASATRLATAVVRICSAPSVEGTLWEVDTALRPEGKAGPLVRTLDSYLTYYRRWAKTWEFQALLKARPVAGDRELGRRFVDAVGPLVWQAAERDNFVEDVQAMRARVLDHVPTRLGGRDLKLGRGGLRDVEFAVQLLQLVHGRVDSTLRVRGTLPALRALAAGGYVGRDDAAQLADAYTFLRTLEHRLQLRRLRRTHLLPAQPAELRWLGRSMGWRQDPAEELLDQWRAQAHIVRHLHERLFYRPLLSAVARLTPDEVRLSPPAAVARLRALGYADPDGALRHIEALTGGVSRQAAIHRTLLPAMLGWFADAADPDGGLLAFRRLAETLGRTPWYLRALRDSGEAARRLAYLLGTSRLVTDLLARQPEGIGMLADDAELTPRPREDIEAEMSAAAGRYDDPVAAGEALRGVRRAELFRIGVADLLGRLSVEQVGEALTAVAAATISVGLAVAERAVAAELRRPLPVRLAVIALGHLGGHEMGYGSDADVLIVAEPAQHAKPAPTDPTAAEQSRVDQAEVDQAALAVAAELRRLLTLPGPEPPLDLDLDLRPEGRSGPLARSVSSYAAYYARWAQPWERQAMLRAEPVAGDEQVAAAFMAVVDPWRWPAGGLPQAAVREVRRIKARIESERLPRGADPTLNVKLGPGGLADVEWTAQLLQLQHAGEYPELRTTSTLTALTAAADAGLLTPAQAQILSEAWQLATRIRNAATLVRGRPSDSIPTDLRDRRAVGSVLGYSPATNGQLVEDYRRAARRARSVVEGAFYS